MTLPDHLPDDDAGPVSRARAVLLKRHEGPSSDDGLSGLLAVAGILSVDVVDHERLALLSHRSMDTAPPGWTALAWLLDGAVIPDGPLEPFRVLASWTADRHLVWGDDPRPGGPTQGVKMISFVNRLDGLDDTTFHDRYVSHGSVARRHHGMERYRQNIVVGGSSDGPAPDAVSELWFRDEEAWREDFYLEPDSRDAIGADVARFLDRRTTSTTLVRQYQPAR